MKISLRPLESIKPYEKNPRRNDRAVDAVVASIQEFGFRQPIVVDSDGVIIIGHTRWKAARQIGLAKVPVHVATDLTAEQIKASSRWSRTKANARRPSNWYAVGIAGWHSICHQQSEETAVANAEFRCIEVIDGYWICTMNIACLDCGVEPPMDTVLTGKQWDRICPEGGVLCASCIIKRAAKFPEFIGATMHINTIDDYHTCIEPGGRVFAFLKLLGGEVWDSNENAWVKCAV
jgi:hypothetical protein